MDQQSREREEAALQVTKGARLKEGTLLDYRRKLILFACYRFERGYEEE
jgi:hypothetical protein